MRVTPKEWHVFVEGYGPWTLLHINRVMDFTHHSEEGIYGIDVVMLKVSSWSTVGQLRSVRCRGKFVAWLYVLVCPLKLFIK